MIRVVSKDGLDIWARLAQKYAERRAALKPYWRSVTELINPPKIAALARKHKELEEEVDVLYLLRSIEGTALHDALASVAKENELVGHRIYHTIQPEGLVITGEPDVIILNGNAATIVDFKRVKASAAIYADSLEKYEWQVRLYAWLLKKEMGIEQINLRLEMRFSDWHELEAKKDSRYPQSALVVHDVEPISMEEAEAYLRERIRVHLAAEKDCDAVKCTEEERWARGGYWCLIGANGRMMSRSRCETRAEVEVQHAARGGTIVYRPARSMRCSPHGDYGGCPVRKVCKQYLEEILPMEVFDMKEVRNDDIT